MKARQLKKAINSGRFTSILKDGYRFFDAVVKGRKVTLYKNGVAYENADLEDLTLAHIGQRHCATTHRFAGGRYSVLSFVGGKNSPVGGSANR